MFAARILAEDIVKVEVQNIAVKPVILINTDFLLKRSANAWRDIMMMGKMYARTAIIVAKSANLKILRIAVNAPVEIIGMYIYIYLNIFYNIGKGDVFWRVVDYYYYYYRNYIID